MILLFITKYSPIVTSWPMPEHAQNAVNDSFYCKKHLVLQTALEPTNIHFNRELTLFSNRTNEYKFC